MRKLYCLLPIACCLLLLLPIVSHGTTLNQGAIDPFGDASDGVFTSTGAHEWSPAVISSHGPIVKQYSSFTLSAGHSITTSEINEGIYIFVKGAATVAGSITQTDKAGASSASHAVPGTAIISRKAADHLLSISSLPGISDGISAVVGGDGGAGGQLFATSASGGYGSVIGGGCGGGGEGGSCNSSADSDSGYAISGHPGIYGAGGKGGGFALYPTIGQLCKCSGGTVYGGAGGAGSSSPGGAIWVIAKSLTIESTARFYINSTVNGTDGSNASGSLCNADGGSGGGGAGGGLVALCYLSLTDNTPSMATACFPRTGSSGGAGGTRKLSGTDGDIGDSSSPGHVYKIDLKAGTITMVY